MFSELSDDDVSQSDRRFQTHMRRRIPLRVTGVFKRPLYSDMI
jgi:hypothetical protein